MHRHFWRFRRRVGGYFLVFSCDCGEDRVRDVPSFWGTR